MISGKEKGFSLLEVLIAFVILTVGVLGAVSLIIRSTQTNVLTRQYEQAHTLASSFIELAKGHRKKIDSYLREEDTTIPAAVTSCTTDSLGCTEQEQINTNIYTFNQAVKASGLPDPKWKVKLVASNLDSVSGNNLYEVYITWGSTNSRLNYVETFTIYTK